MAESKGLGLCHYLGAVPVPIVLGVIMTLWVLDIPQQHIGVMVLPLNLVFVTLAGLLVAYLSALSVSRSGSPLVLMMGCGALIWGLNGLDSALAMQTRDINRGVIVYNLGMLLAGFCHVLAMIAAYWPETRLGNARLKMYVAYVLAMGVVAIVILLSHVSPPPPFVNEQMRPTALRQWVLATAIQLHLLAAIGLCPLALRRRWAFGWWYGLGMAFIAIGLLAFLIAPMVGTPVGWLGRLCQYLGSIYVVTAVFIATRASGDWDAKLQIALSESRERFRTLASATFEGILVSEVGLIVDANQQIHDMLGCRHPELIGRHLVDLVPPDQQARVRDDLSDGCTSICEYCLLRKDGMKIVVESRSRTLQSAGKPRLITAMRDVTDHKRQAQALAEANQKLAQSLVAIKQSHDDLERRVAQRTAELQVRANQLSRLTSELTLTEQRERRRLAKLLHDHLQQLLVGARLGLNVLTRRANKDQKQAVAQIDDFLAEAISASRSLTVELSPPILHEAGLCAGLKWLARWMKEKHGLEVTLHCEAHATSEREEVRVLVFESVRELLFNVVKHAGVREATLEVGSYGPNHFCATVSDFGCGFDPQAVDLASAEHNGFGLFSIRERLAMLGGRLEIQSAPGQGARFSLIAPVHLQPALLCERPAKDGAAAAHLDAARHPTPRLIQPANASTVIRLLLVDDHEVMRQGLAALLAEEPKIEVIAEASNGIEAVEQAHRLHPDVILMDFSMPLMDGLEATRRIHLELPHIKVIGLSMYEESDRAAAMMDAGAVAYLSKSGKSEILIDTIKAVVRSPMELAQA